MGILTKRTDSAATGSVRGSKLASLFVLCAMFFGPTAYANCIKTIAWKNKPPYLFRDAKGEIHGIHADLIREALRRMSCTAQFVELPWVRAMIELKDGRVDMVPGAGETRERDEFAFFSRPTNFARNVLFVSGAAARKYKLNNLSDVIGTNFRLGVTIKADYGGVYSQLLNNPGFASRLVPILDRIGGWKMIKEGRLEGQIADELTGSMEIRELNLDQLIYKSTVAIEDHPEPDRIAISKRSNDQGFVDQFNAIFDDMIQDGSYRRIFIGNFDCDLSLQKLGCN